uniref:Uncharacterized protein n=1 Tax=Megaselia scalaris TaxID=36166 RepID=T1GKV7_MEGSC
MNGVKYDQKHNHHQVSHDHHGNQYEQHQQHYHQEQRDQHGQKLIKTDYDYQRKNNQVVIQNEEVKTGYDHGYQPQPQPEKKISTPSKRVHIKLPEFDYSSYTKTDSEIKYDSRPVVVDKPTSKEPRKYQKTKQQYVQKPKPQNRYEHIQRIPNDSPRSQRPRIKARIQKPSHTYRQRPQTQISLPQDDYKRLKGKYRKYHLKAYDEDKDHVLYYVDQPVQIYDPQEKKFHQFDKLSDEEAEEIQKKTSEYKGVVVSGVVLGHESQIHAGQLHISGCGFGVTMLSSLGQGGQVQTGQVHQIGVDVVVDSSVVVVSGVEGVTSGVGVVISDVVEEVTSGVEGVVISTVDDVISGVISGVEGVISGVISGVEGVTSGVEGVVISAVDGVISGVVFGVEGVISGVVISGVDGIISVVTLGVEGVISGVTSGVCGSSVVRGLLVARCFST